MNNYMCDRCGAMLDPGERCDCWLSKYQAAKKWERMTVKGSHGQITLNLREVENEQNYKN